ncbi:MAG: hypothetical protein ACOCRO_01040 [Halanaerobiales bacterium]
MAVGIAKTVYSVLEQNDYKKEDVYINDIGPFYNIKIEINLTDKFFNHIIFKPLFPVIFYEKMDKKPESFYLVDDFTIDEKYKEWVPSKRISNLIRQRTGIPLSNKIMDDIYSIHNYYKDIVYCILDHFSNINNSFMELEYKLSNLLNKIQVDRLKMALKDNLNYSVTEEKGLDQLFNSFTKYYKSILKKVDMFIKTKIKEDNDFLKSNLDALYEQGKVNFTKKHTALSQLLPKRIRGINLSDLSSKNNLTTKNQKESWIKLYLILIGFYEIFMLKQMGSGNMLYSVINPQSISLKSIEVISNDINKDYYYRFETLEKQNIVYLSKFVIKLLDTYLEDFDDIDEVAKEFVLSNYIRGLKNTYLVDMGQNHVFKNIYDLNIPNWVVIGNKEEKEDFILFFQELIDLIEPINDKNEDIQIFQELYRFLTTEKVDYLLNYYYQHALLAIDRMGKDKPARMFTKRSVVFVMSKLEEVYGGHYSQILQDEGFRNFAKAIRNSTLNPIYHENKKKVKFGLLQEIRRAALNKDTLVVKLTEFMADYNNENGLEIYRNKHPMRGNLTTTDLEQVVNLIDHHDSKIIGNMLLAYGFGKEEKDTNVENKNEETERMKEEKSNG